MTGRQYVVAELGDSGRWHVLTTSSHGLVDALEALAEYRRITRPVERRDRFHVLELAVGHVEDDPYALGGCEAVDDGPGVW